MDARLFGLAAAIRFVFLRFTGLPESIENRVELANTQIGIKAVREAIYLLKHSVPIYQNRSTCQPSPLIVSCVGFFQWLGLDDLMFIALDLLAAALVWKIVEKLKERAAKKQAKDDTPSNYKPIWIAALYLFHPFSILTCLARSSALFNTVACLAAFHFALCHHRRREMLALALSTVLSLYSVTLLVPLVFLLLEGTPLKKRTLVASIWNFASFLCFWSSLSWWISAIPVPSPENWFGSIKDFVLYATPIGCNCFVSDLRPNLGLAWYLFVEMFDHFRSFFLVVFQLHIFIYMAPAAIKFKSDPVLLAAFLTAVPSIFKPYPVLADSVLLLTFVSFVGEGILKKSVMMPIYLFAMVGFSLIGPINWHYWIQQGSGNANFFYATTLFYNGSHIFLVLDVVYQWMIREIERMNPGADLSTVYQY